MKAQCRGAALAAAVAAVCFVGPVAFTYGAGKAPSGVTPDQKADHHPYLGVGVESITPALVSHLPKTLSNGQGVVVAMVAEGSPAAKAGLKVHDILLSYGNQKLFSPRQLVGLVRQDKAGHEVALSIAREGKPLTVKVTLGTHKVAHASPAPGVREPEFGQMPTPGWFMPFWQLPHWFTGPEAPPSKPREWESFDSMTIKKLGKGRFHAEIQYLNKKGGLDHKTFEGSREEIRKAILAHKDLPAEESHQLLRSLNMPMEEVGPLGKSVESEFKDLGKDFGVPGIL